MTANEGYSSGVGSSFSMEVGLFRSCADTAAHEDYIDTIAQIIQEFDENNPFVGREVIFIPDTAIVLTHLDDGHEESLPAGGEAMDCKVIGFFPVIEDVGGIYNAELAVELEFGENSPLHEFAAHIPASAIRSMELRDSRHPFLSDSKRFQQAVKGFPQATITYPEADQGFFLEDAVTTIKTQSPIMHAQVELLFTDHVTIGFSRTEIMPFWADDIDHTGDEPKEAYVFCGPLTGTVAGYEYRYEGEDDYDLIILLAINQDQQIDDEDNARYLFINCADISWGRIISGPSYN